MQPEDFEGMFKYKLLLPGLYIVNWAIMLIGPLLYPVGYQMFTIVVFAYMLLKTIFNFAWCVLGFHHATRYLEAHAQKFQNTQIPPP